MPELVVTRTHAAPFSADLGPHPTARRLRVALIAPHFAEYSARLAMALAETAEVLLVTEVGNFRQECAGLALNLDTVARASFTSSRVLIPISLAGLLERRAIRRALAAFAPDVVHIQEQGDAFTAKIAQSVATTCPVVLTVHDPAPHSGHDAVVAQQFAAGLARLREIASAYHVHGAYCEGVLRRARGDAKPIVSTAHGVILSDGSQVAATDGTYLFFGRMEAYKGLDTLLDAIALLPEGPGLRIMLAGRGPELERHRDRITTISSVEILDRFLTPREAVAAFQRARVVLTPYHDATQSGVISAAMGNCKPVITSSVGGLPDSVEHGVTGLVVPPGDPRALADAMLALRDEAIYRPLAEGARAAAAGDFAWARIAARLNTLYAALAEAHRNRA